MLDFLGGLFGGDSTVAKIATEWIETNQEKAEAKAVMIKALDPNGSMRVYITKVVLRLFSMYMLIATFLVLAYSFGFGDSTNTKIALENLVSLFLPLATMTTLIISASFGVNAMNVKTEQFKLKEKL